MYSFVYFLIFLRYRFVISYYCYVWQYYCPMSIRWNWRRWEHSPVVFPAIQENMDRHSGRTRLDFMFYIFIIYFLCDIPTGTTVVLLWFFSANPSRNDIQPTDVACRRSVSVKRLNLCTYCYAESTSPRRVATKSPIIVKVGKFKT